MSISVDVIVTGRKIGKGTVVPFSSQDGLQFYMAGGVRTGRFVIYDVPTYEVRVQSGGTYTAIRFGLRNKGDNRTPGVRPCDAGLSETRICIPGWLPHYSPHSFRGGSRPGAWQLLQGKPFYIHEGADRTRGQVGGTLGCIEILDGRWNAFLGDIERIAGMPCDRIAATRKLRVTLELARYPDATLRT
jgi:hypothetical protein